MMGELLLKKGDQVDREDGPPELGDLWLAAVYPGVTWL